MNDRFSIVLASDNNYAIPLGITILSLIVNTTAHNREKLNIYVLDAGISSSRKKEITDIVYKNKAKIFFYNVEEP
jgi:lipopolysaccharide biosynthesis glycosyltransferase